MRVYGIGFRDWGFGFKILGVQGLTPRWRIKMHKKIEPAMETWLFSGLQVWGSGLRVFFGAPGLKFCSFAF